MTGALFALLIAATTLTLMLRILGTDKLVADWVTALPGNELTVVAIVLLRDRALRLRARRVRDHLRDRADRGAAAA